MAGVPADLLQFTGTLVEGKISRSAELSCAARTGNARKLWCTAPRLVNLIQLDNVGLPIDLTAVEHNPYLLPSCAVFPGEPQLVQRLRRLKNARPNRLLSASGWRTRQARPPAMAVGAAASPASIRLCLISDSCGRPEVCTERE